jgi:hypothetical protein
MFSKIMASHYDFSTKITKFSIFHQKSLFSEHFQLNNDHFSKNLRLETKKQKIDFHSRPLKLNPGYATGFGIPDETMATLRKVRNGKESPNAEKFSLRGV